MKLLSISYGKEIDDILQKLNDMRAEAAEEIFQKSTDAYEWWEDPHVAFREAKKDVERDPVIKRIDHEIKKILNTAILKEVTWKKEGS